MAEVPVQPQPTKQGINWKNILIGAVIGAVLIGVGVLIFYLYQSDSEETTTTTTPKTSTPSAKISTPSAEKDETAGWKTYTATGVVFSKVSYSIKYPPTLNKGSNYDEPYAYSSKFSNYKETEGYGATACEGEGKGSDCFTISVALSDKGGPEESTRDYNFVKSMSIGSSKTDNPTLGDIKYTRNKDVSYGGSKWLSYSAERDPKWGAKYLYGFAVKKDGVVYYLDLTSDNKSAVDNNKGLLEKMLSTFKFLD